MTAVSLKFKYASAAFVAVLLAMAAVTVLLVWQHDSDTRHLGAMAEDTAREGVDVELRARASSTAAHAADSITNPIRTRDTVTVARRLLPFIEDPTVAAITVMDSTGTVVYTWHRSVQPQKGVLQAEATEPVRTLVENIPGAATPETFGTVKVLLEQAAPVPETSLTGRLIAASASQSHLALILAGVLALLVGLVGAAIAWRAAHKIERPIDALIKSAERIGQGDYTRPLEVRRRDVLGDLQQALERMRARLRQYTINKSYLHSVLNSMTDAVFVTSPDGVIKLANSAACKLLGFSEEEILGRGIVAVLDERERENFDLTQAAQETRETVVRTRAGTDHPRVAHRIAHRERRSAVPGQHLRRPQHHRSQACRAAHPLPRPLRRAHQDPEPDAVPPSAAADDRPRVAQWAGGRAVVSGYGPVQRSERHLRSRLGRPCARSAGGAPHPVTAERHHRRPARRR